MRAFVRVGRDVDVIREFPDGIELFGRARLRPGFRIEILPAVGAPSNAGRPAVVWSWRIRCLGSGGPIFRGECRWCPSAPIGANAVDESSAGNRKDASPLQLVRDLMNPQRPVGGTP